MANGLLARTFPSPLNVFQAAPRAAQTTTPASQSRFAVIKGGDATAFSYDDKGQLVTPQLTRLQQLGRFANQSRRAAWDLFVPTNHQESVSKDYVPTRIWSSVHDMACSVSNLFSGIVFCAALGQSPLWAGPGMAVFNLIRDQMTQVLQLGISKAAPLAEKKARPWMLAGDVIERVGVMADSAAGVMAAVPGMGPLALLIGCTVNAGIRCFAGTMKGASMAEIGPRQAKAGNLGEIGVKNGCQGLLAIGLGNGINWALFHFGAMAALGGPIMGPVVIGTAFSLLAIAAQGEFVRKLNYHPVNEDAVNRFLDGATAADKAPDHNPWTHVADVLVRDKIQIGQDMTPLTKDLPHLEELATLYADRNHMMDFQNGVPTLIMRECRFENGQSPKKDEGGKPVTAEDRFLGVLQVAHAVRLGQSEEYKTLAAKDGAEAADRWVREESLRQTPQSATEFLDSMSQAGWTADALRFNDLGLRARW